MKILILEDEITHQARIETVLTEISQELDMNLDFKTTGKIKEFQEYVKNEEINQLYFLDIDIKGEETKGLEIARFIRHHNPYAIIVFVTTRSEFASMTFKYKVSALDFIDKDINDRSFKKRIKDNILYTKSIIFDNSEIVDYFKYSYRGSEVHIPFNDILYIETTGHSHKLRIVGKNFLKEFYGTLADITEKYEKTEHFFSPHKSFLANIRNIQGYDKKTKEVIFTENNRCPVSRLRIKVLKEILENK